MKATVQRNRSFTTTLPEMLLQELDSTAKTLKVQKNDIIAEALVRWNKDRKQVLLAQSYQVAGKAKKEIVAIADEGLDEWFARKV